MNVAYIGIYLLILVVPLIASININSTYKKYKMVANKKGLSGFEVARKILDENGLKDMYIVEVRGELTDHYDPTQKVLRLSTDIFHGETIAAAAVATLDNQLKTFEAYEARIKDLEGKILDKGDVENPKGGVRGVIKEKQKY